MIRIINFFNQAMITNNTQQYKANSATIAQGDNYTTGPCKGPQNFALVKINPRVFIFNIGGK